MSLEGVRGWYGPSQALHGVSLTVRDGEVLALLGRNGAGKTSLLRAVMGLLPRVDGSIRLRGVELRGRPPHEVARQGIGYCPDDRGIYATLSVQENLRLPPRVAEGGFDEAELLALFPNLAERAASAGSHLSGGEQQMLAIARILRSGARLLLLDEPTEGLAPVIVERIGALLRRVRERGYTVLLVEQNLGFAAALADRHVLLESGRVVAAYDGEALRRDFSAVAARIGV
ncbi:branched-chain amino acid transport ATP-binding protein LivF [Piscinibacter sakaiensis]|uniref:Branched-chain amino acid transport ATP-binding protein LivF n=1 Tax=Piscinibacter sakaiensis TaxID=1547922 RepID=A0A0K8P643_PISS1|nr:branched-chain amino acid transport ATP-binding protein LivF [Piscinibacter sakaiensis]